MPQLFRWKYLFACPQRRRSSLAYRADGRMPPPDGKDDRLRRNRRARLAVFRNRKRMTRRIAKGDGESGKKGQRRGIGHIVEKDADRISR
jgi:hypothetical protein